ncbi:uncharacterized protein LOC136083545 [Hydra vulgaris]|uniref:Uncharacterized protein LOC136083545 n=1 Tax=Hydra vulgaris TaxID=6087 RepID=A0ABM4CBH4_HYDVU
MALADEEVHDGDENAKKLNNMPRPENYVVHRQQVDIELVKNLDFCHDNPPSLVSIINEQSMGKEKDISPTKLGLIQGYLSSGNHSNRQIAKCVNVSRATVDRIKRKLDNNQSLKLNKRKNCGRNRITTPRTERKIRDIVIENRRKSKKVLKEIINNEDESTLELLMDKTNFARRRTGEMFNEDCLVERVKHPLKIMVWSVISSQGTGRLYIVKNTMRQDQYIQVLKERMIPQAMEWYPIGNFTFQHDSAPCHKAKTVTKFLEAEKIHVLPWPGNSPDLNPI